MTRTKRTARKVNCDSSSEDEDKSKVGSNECGTCTVRKGGGTCIVRTELVRVPSEVHMKSEKLSDDDVPFKTLFPDAFKVKGGSMKTDGVRKSKTKAKDKVKDKVKDKTKVKDKSGVKWKDQDEIKDTSAVSEVKQDDSQDEKLVKTKILLDDVFGDDSDDDGISAFFGK
jgi:hypothetical protein